MQAILTTVLIIIVLGTAVWLCDIWKKKDEKKSIVKDLWDEADCYSDKKLNQK